MWCGIKPARPSSFIQQISRLRRTHLEPSADTPMSIWEKLKLVKKKRIELFQCVFVGLQ